MGKLVKRDNGPEILKRKGIIPKIIEGKLVLRRSDVSPIDNMYNRGFLSVAQFSAGQELYRCYVDGWGESNSYEVKERVDGGGKEKEITTSRIHAQQKFEKGKKAAGRQWDLIDRVVINEIPMSCRGMNGHRISQLRYQLRNTLDDIARCYGFM